MKNNAAPKSSLKKALPSRIFYDHSYGKDRELNLVKGFLQRLCLGVIDIKESERPDFIITLEDMKNYLRIGCEITLFYSDQNRQYGSLARRFVEEWRKFSYKLMEEMGKEGEGLEHLYGSVFFKEPSARVLDKINKDQLIRELVQISKDHRSKKTVSLSIFDGSRYPLLTKTVQKIFIENIYPEKNIAWWPAHLQTGKIPDPTELLVKIIQQKNKTAASYHWSGMSEKWLIVIAEALSTADMAFLDNGMDFRPFRKESESIFTRIYLWDRFLDEISELFPSHGKIFGHGKSHLHINRLPETIRPFIKKLGSIIF